MNDQRTEKFALSLSNKALLAVVIAIPVLSFTMTSSFSSGRLIRAILSSVLVPAVLAWIGWFLMGKRERVRDGIFNLVLVLFLASGLNTAIDRVVERVKVNPIQSSIEDFKSTLATAETAEEVSAAYNELTNDVEMTLRMLSASSTGEDKKFFAIMADHIKEVSDYTILWQEAYTAAISPDILNYASLTSDEAFEKRIAILRVYTSKTNDYMAYREQQLPTMRSRLSVLSDNNQKAKNAIESAKKKMRQQDPFLLPLLQAHLEYGENMIEILNLLQSDKEGWSAEKGALLNHTDTFGKNYDTLLESLQKNEAAILALSGKLFEIM